MGRHVRDVSGAPLPGIALAAALCCACSGGQSGNEGEIPSAPCARQGALVTGIITSVGGACVSIEVDSVVQGIDTSTGTEIRSWPATGDILEGRLATFYAYTRQFEPGQSVAVLIDNGPDASPS